MDRHKKASSPRDKGPGSFTDSLMKGRPAPGAIGLAIIVFVTLGALLFLNAMNKPPSRDEQMYCTAGVLMAQGLNIYRDFSYVSQLPYHPLLLSGLYKTLNTTHYLLVARLITVLAEILTMACILAICLHILREHRGLGLLLGVGAITFYAANPLVYMANGYAWNHGVVVFLVMLSVYLSISCPAETRPCNGRYFVIGMLLTGATCMRITTALILALFTVFAFMKTSTSRRVNTFARLSFGAGVLTALAWPLWVICQAGDAFLTNLIEIPRLYGEYLREAGESHSKLDMTLACLIQPGYLALLAAIGFVWLQVRKMAPGHASRKAQTLMSLTPAVFYVIAFIPPTLWRQYLAVPVPFLTLVLVVLFSRLCACTDAVRRRALQKACIASMVCVLIALVFHMITLLKHPPKIAPAVWEPMKLHRVGRKIAEAVQGTGPLLTLAPLYALEGGGPIYPELSCGSVVFRIGDLLSPELRAQTHVVGPGSLSDLIRKKPPSAVLLGVELPSPKHELHLQALTDASWQSLTLGNGVELHLPPAQR